MTDFISVIIPTYNPNLNRLQQTLDALKKQTIAHESWELIIVDNNSGSDFSREIDYSWHACVKLVSEPRQGLTYARLKGFDTAKGNIIVLFDDDNKPGEEYLAQTLQIFKTYPELGAAGGKSLPQFESPAPEWLNNFYENLALRDPGESIVIGKWEHKYPEFAPVGAGMAIRKAALKTYLHKTASQTHIIHDRKGDSLSSGGDNDMVLEITKSGWDIGYFPLLILHHIIPKQRMQVAYLAKLVHDTNISWIKVLRSHGICPWKEIPKWTVPLRKAKAWLVYGAWKNEVNYVKWKGACGVFDSLAQID